MWSKAFALSAVCLVAATSAEAGSLELDPLRGALTLERADLSLGEGDASYVLRRSLQTQGWAWSCDSRLVRAEGGDLVWIDEGGRLQRFEIAGDRWIARYGTPWQLERADDGYALQAQGRTYRFDMDGQLLSRTTRGSTLRFVPGPHGTEAVEGPWGRLDVERTPLGVTRVALAETEVRYAYEAGRLVRVARDSLSEAYAYDNAGRLVRAGETEITYDGANRVTRLSGGRIPLSASYPQGHAWVCEVREGARTTRYTRSERVLEVAELDRCTRQVRFDARQRPHMIERDGVLEASMSYDAKGRLTLRHTPEGDLRLSYGAGEQPTEIQLPSGEALRFVYDEAGRVLAKAHALGTERFVYDARGLLVGHQDAAGRRASYRHDARGYVVAVKVQAKQTRILRSSAGDVLAVKHPDGRVERYSERGAALKVATGAGTVRAAAFDDQGRMIAYQDEFGRATRLAYNGFGQVSRSYDKDGDRFSCEYDTAGRLTALTDAAGNTVSYSRPDARTLIVDDPSVGRREQTFDTLGRLVREVRGEATLSFRYDEAGRLVARTTPRGEERFAYDRAGRLLSQAGPDGELRYTYDEAGRLTSTENRVLFERIDYRYEGANTEPSEVRYPWGSVRYAYDAAGRLSAVTSDEGTITIERTADGRRASVRYPSGVETRYTYSGSELSELSTWKESALLTKRAYRYDARGRIATTTDERDRLTTFSHDRRGRLLSAKSAERNVRYRYDAAGNRTAVEVGGELAELEVGAGNRVLAHAGTSYTYGSHGALIGRDGPAGAWRFSVDVDGRLRSAQGPGRQRVRYGYAPDGTPLWRETNGERERFLVDRKQVVGEFDEAGLARSYVRGEGLDDVLQSKAAGGERFTFHRDRVSSVTALTDAEGEVVARYRYGAFGEALSAEGPAAAANRWRYAGRPLDAATGLYDMRARHYDARLGRFTSPDPSGREGGLNLYAYAENDPTRFNDPLGLWSSMAAQWSDPDFQPRPFGSGIAQAFRDGLTNMEQTAQWLGPNYYLKFQLAKGAGQAGVDAGQGVLDLFKKQTWVDMYEFASELDDWETVKAVGAHIYDSGADAGDRYLDALINDPAEAARMSGYGGASIAGAIFGGKGIPQLTQVARTSRLARLAGVADRAEDVVDTAEDVADTAEDVADRAEDVVDAAEDASPKLGLVQLLDEGAEVKPHGDFRRGLQEGLDAPVSAAAREALAGRWTGIQERAAALGRGGWRSSPDMQRQRMEGSGTIRGDHGTQPGTDVELPARNFRAADDMVRVWARSGQPLTLDRIKRINEFLGDGLEHNGGVPGEFRSQGWAAAGGVPARMYVAGDEVQDAMSDFMKWYGEAEASGMPPVELAARSYQRMVSIHPFADGNGRTSRLVMDYVLQQHGLPPATMANVNVAVFGGEAAMGIRGGASVTPEVAITRVTEGVERSLTLLEQVR